MLNRFRSSDVLCDISGDILVNFRSIGRNTFANKRDIKWVTTVKITFFINLFKRIIRRIDSIVLLIERKYIVGYRENVSKFHM